MPDFDTYLSPFTQRYGTKEMRYLWSETNKRILWRQLWVVLAEVQSEFGLVTANQVADLRQHMKEIDIPLALEIEKTTLHDLMSELQVFSGQCRLGGGIIHFGATSADIEDNVDALRSRSGLGLLLNSLLSLLKSLASLITKWADTPVMAFTHLQPAEPTTLGYRLALYGQDLLHDFMVMSQLISGVKGKGFKGAVGTSAAFAEILGKDNLAEFELKLSHKLDLQFYPVASQVYPRKQDYDIVSSLAGLGASLYKLAIDIRFLQSPAIGEISEPFKDGQVGSSAMPFKRNPIRSEKINSLARYLATLPCLAWDNAANSILERTLDDSANRRILLPEAFLATDELLLTANEIIQNLQIDELAIARNFTFYSPFAATERLLMASVKAGANRQKMHILLRSHALKAWQIIKEGGENPLIDDLCMDSKLSEYLSEKEIRALMESKFYTGDAVERARNLANEILELSEDNLS